MKRRISIKILVCFLIAVAGTYALTNSIAITIGVAILLWVMDTLLNQWADKKTEQYYGKKGKDKDGETH